MIGRSFSASSPVLAPEKQSAQLDGMKKASRVRFLFLSPRDIWQLIRDFKSIVHTTLQINPSDEEEGARSSSVRS